ncbi:hypothetical protein RNZ50_26755 [Paracoccaceae bacterium Fryx2]|nr:hypothetical protein [Paracoccaceae bacterium Fryx2]
MEKIPEEPACKTPDFKIEIDGGVILVEVKQFEINEVSRAIEIELDQTGVHVGDVDFSHDGGLGRKLGQQAAQLQDASQKGFPTLGVIYSNRVLGQTDYQVRHVLESRTVAIAAQISAVLYVRNEGIRGETPPFTLYYNPNATVPFPAGLF